MSIFRPIRKSPGPDIYFFVLLARQQLSSRWFIISIFIFFLCGNICPLICRGRCAWFVLYTGRNSTVRTGTNGRTYVTCVCVGRGAAMIVENVVVVMATGEPLQYTLPLHVWGCVGGEPPCRTRIGELRPSIHHVMYVCACIGWANIALLFSPHLNYVYPRVSVSSFQINYNRYVTGAGEKPTQTTPKTKGYLHKYLKMFLHACSSVVYTCTGKG